MVVTDVFLSHNWGEDIHSRDNHKRVSIINKKLNEINYRTWFDENEMFGDIRKTMAEGIEQTQGVLVFLTRKYHDKVTQKDNPNDNCQLEFDHAVNKITSNKMIAIIMEEEMNDTNKWKGTFSMYLQKKMYVDFSGDLTDSNYLNKQMIVLDKELKALGIKPSGSANLIKDDLGGKQRKEDFPNKICGKHISKTKDFLWFCHPNYNQETVLKEMSKFEFNNELKVSIHRGSNLIEYGVEWNQISEEYFDNFFSTRINDVISIPQSGDRIIQTLEQWCLSTKKTSDHGALIVGGVNFNKHFEILKAQNHTLYKNSEKTSCIVFNSSEDLLLCLTKWDSEKEDLKSILEICKENTKMLITLYQKELKNSAIKVIGLVITESEIDNINLTCEHCKIFLISKKTFGNLELFENWYQNFYEHFDEDLIGSSSNEQEEDIFSLFCKKFLTLMACAECEHLPNFTESPSSQIEQISLLLNPEQMDIVYSTDKCIILKGDFGTGKSIVIQKKIENLLKNINEKEQIYYINYDKLSNAHIAMEDFMTKSNSDQLIVKRNTEGALLSNLIQSIVDDANKKNSKVAHVFVDEYNSEDLTQSEVNSLKSNIAQKNIFREANIFIVSQPIERKRTVEANGAIEVYEGSLFSELKDVPFKIKKLTNVMRNTSEINNLAKLSESYLRKTKNEFKQLEPTHRSSQSSSFSSQSEDQSKTAGNKKRNSIKGSDLQAAENKIDDELKTSFNNEEKGKEYSTDVNETLGERAKIIEDSLHESNVDIEISQATTDNQSTIITVGGLDHAFKLATKTYLKKGKVVSKTTSYFTFISDSVMGHKIKSTLPKLIEPLTFENENENVISIAAFLDSIGIEKKRVVVVHFESQAPVSFDNALYLLKTLNRPFKLKFTSSIKEFHTKKANLLITSFFQIRGMEFPNILLLLDPNEYHLKHYLPEAITRCTENLTMMLLGEKHANKAFTEYLQDNFSTLSSKMRRKLSTNKFTKDVVLTWKKQNEPVIKEIIVEKCFDCTERSNFYCENQKDNVISINVNSNQYKELKAKHLTQFSVDIQTKEEASMQAQILLSKHINKTQTHVEMATSN